MGDGEPLEVEPSLSFHLVLSASWLIGCDQPSSPELAEPAYWRGFFTGRIEIF